MEYQEVSLKFNSDKLYAKTLINLSFFCQEESAAFLITVFNKNLITPLISVMVNAKFDYDIMKFKIRQYLNMNGVIIDE